jgi:integrase
MNRAEKFNQQVDVKVRDANDKLKAGNVRARIQRIGDKLYLQATLPPKPGSVAEPDHQQRIALGIAASPAGVELAVKQAKKVSALLDCREFDWTPYLSPQHKPPETVGEWVKRFEQEFRESVSETTWKTDYREVLIKLDESKPLTIDLLEREILRTEPNSRSRKRYAQTLGKLAKFADLEVDFARLKGSYSASAVDPRSLPSDEQIAEWFHKITNPQWRYVYGLIATFGLRPHEPFFLDVADIAGGGETVSIMKGLERTRKHKQRQIWALYREWVDEFGLRCGELPSIKGQTHSDYGDRVSQYFHRNAKLPFNAYDLRHCWAVRRILFGYPDALSAEQMGHTLAVHSQTYQAWLTSRTHQAVEDRVMRMGDRPVAPLHQKSSDLATNSL